MLKAISVYDNTNTNKSQLSRLARKQRAGFTIVELLIVVVVIAILAAVTVVAYNGISNRAVESALKSDLTTVAKQLQIDKIKSGSTVFPETLADANEGNGLSASSEANSYYTTLSDGQGFCLTLVSIRNASIIFSIDNSGVIRAEACEGYDVDAEEGGFDTFTWGRIGEVIGGSENSVATNHDGSIVYLLSRHNSDPAERHIKKSLDGGQTWSVLEPTREYFWDRVRPSKDGQTIIASYERDSSYEAFTAGVWISYNGGSTWTEVNSPDLKTVSNIAISGNGQVMVASGSLNPTGAGSYVSIDSGATWTQIEGSRSREGMALSYTGDHGYLTSCTSGSSSRFFISTNKGSTWEHRGLNPNCTGHLVVSSDGQLVLAGPTSGSAYLWKSEDGGVTFSEMAIPGPSGSSVTRVFMSESGRVVVFFKSSTINAYVSKDRGETWDYYNTPDGSTIAMRYIRGATVSGNGRVVYAINANNLYKGTFE